MPTRPPIHRPAGYRPAQAERQYDRQRNRLDPTRRLLWSEPYRRFRRQVIAQRPLCEDCLAMTPQRVTPAAHVHHKRKLRDHPEDLLDADQVLCLCAGCHSVRTNRGE